jgi:hypothetical protein
MHQHLYLYISWKGAVLEYREEGRRGRRGLRALEENTVQIFPLPNKTPGIGTTKKRVTLRIGDKMGLGMFNWAGVLKGIISATNELFLEVRWNSDGM